MIIAETTSKRQELAEASVKRMIPVVPPEKEVSCCFSFLDRTNPEEA